LPNFFEAAREICHDSPTRPHYRRRAAIVGAPALARAHEPTSSRWLRIHSIAPYFYDRFTPADYEVQVIPFESPSDGKNAVVTKSG
jgi:hypothetical protein